MQRRVVWFLWALVGCGTQVDADEESASGATLELGDRGEPVRIIYGYLAEYGYFPNRQLEREYPGFRPLVAEAPARPDVYDDKLAAAVRLFQENVGLEPTGRVDRETRARMLPRECHWPDGYGDQSAVADNHQHQKFAVNNTKLTGTTWSLESWPAGTTEAAVANATQQMIALWGNVHRNSFTRVAAGQGNVKIRFEVIDGRATDNDGDNLCTPTSINPSSPDRGCIGGRGSSGTGITLDIDEAWEFVGTTSTVPSYNNRRADYRSVLLHEFGHVLGLWHSSVLTATMYYTRPKGSMQRSLSADDRNGIRARSALFTQNPLSRARDVHGTPWSFISDQPTAGGFTIYRFTGSWQQVPGGAVRISGDDSWRLWIVNDAGTIFFRDTGNTTWYTVAGCARDIGVAWAGHVWVVGCDGALYQGNMDPGADDATLIANKDTGFTRVGSNGFGNPALVNVTGGQGVDGHAVYAVDVNGDLWGLTTGAWNRVPITNKIALADVGASQQPGVVWATGKSGSGVYTLNMQAEIPNTQTPFKSGWEGYPSFGAQRITVNTAGQPSYINGVGSVMTTSK